MCFNPPIVYDKLLGMLARICETRLFPKLIKF